MRVDFDAETMRGFIVRNAELLNQNHRKYVKYSEQLKTGESLRRAFAASKRLKSERSGPLVHMSHDLVNAAHNLERHEKQLMALAASRIDEDFDSRTVIRITAREFAETFLKDHTDKKYAFRALKEATEHLFDRKITWKDPENNKKGQRRWIQEMSYHSDTPTEHDWHVHTIEEAHVEIMMSEFIVDHLKKNGAQGGYLFYRLMAFARLKTRYGQRLFEQLMKFANTGWLEISVADLRRVLEIPDSYFYPDGRILDSNTFKKKVLDPAIKDIAQNFNVNYVPIKKGRSISKFRFTFQRQQHHKTTESKEKAERRRLTIKNALRDPDLI